MDDELLELIEDIYLILDKLCDESSDPDVLQSLSKIELFINNIKRFNA